MSAAARLAGFALTLAAVFGAGYGVGTAVGPLGTADDDRDQQQHEMTEMEDSP